ncbi:MAG: phosphate acetyltransferase [Candidatus Omnitrophica bacterium CG11_big_fil_rev_8_21_14_0_20_42_13]|uniref:Phosphate acetyltransferase n=1 Tax=Candidatus Ghiorseimicrobium undicola TaxID=1974746 RepID=A0A2H0LV72_9BACT|nr:MAG: phosphate acetyltransferase [Candidatus Omnitrophica bacterium CG11_big_fil_rev_8_21_14_0_20_42_13]
MDIENFIREKAKKNKKRIILPEADDQRVIKAADIIRKENIAEVILLSKSNMEKEKIKEYADSFYEIRKAKGISRQEAERVMFSPVYYAAMMVRAGLADGFVAGASHTTPDVARAAIYCVGLDARFSVISSCFIMSVSDQSFGENGLLFFADCGIVPDPNARQLAHIALSTADLAKKILSIEPRVAMLSFSTKGSSRHPLLEKVKEATRLAKEINPDLLLDGEMQADSAIVPEVAKIKNAYDVLEGRANVLIFPDLNSGNIGYKLVQRLSGARAIGPILQGLKKPCCDLSRGCSADDVVDCVAITAIRSQE